MEIRTVELYEGPLAYMLKKSERAKRMHLRVCHRGTVELTLPRYWPASYADQFVSEKSAWIKKHVAYFEQFAYKQVPLTISHARYREHKAAARRLAEERLAVFNSQYDFRYGKVSIRNQQKRWGSCSPEGNLSFNYRIALLPTHLADYVIVHELCHIGAHNHSRRFWDLVAHAIPDFKERILQLNTEHRISFY